MEIKYLIKFGSCMRGHEILVPSPNVFNHCALQILSLQSVQLLAVVQFVTVL